MKEKVIELEGKEIQTCTLSLILVTERGTWKSKQKEKNNHNEKVRVGKRQSKEKENVPQ